jgi:hypothetical protein
MYKWTPNLILAIQAKKKGKLTIYTVHNVLRTETKLTPWVPRPKRGIYTDPVIQNKSYCNTQIPVLWNPPCMCAHGGSSGSLCLSPPHLTPAFPFPLSSPLCIRKESEAGV